MTDEMSETQQPEAIDAEGVPDSAAGEVDADRLDALEAVMFMAAEPIPGAELAEILEVTPADADELIAHLSELYAGRGLQVSRVAGGYQVCTRPEYGPYVAKLHKPERFRLSRAALETLAIVAYKQPITRPEIESIRGVNSDSPVDTLVQYELIREAGRKDTPGRPMLYRTTDNFLGQFGLNSVEDLPRLDAIPADEAAARAEASEKLGGTPDAEDTPKGVDEERGGTEVPSAEEDETQEPSPE